MIKTGMSWNFAFTVKLAANKHMNVMEFCVHCEVSSQQAYDEDRYAMEFCIHGEVTAKIHKDRFVGTCQGLLLSL